MCRLDQKDFVFQRIAFCRFANHEQKFCQAREEKWRRKSAPMCQIVLQSAVCLWRISMEL
jgi:hypothetical protein